MELRVHHRTTYRYQSPVDMAQHMLHLSPRDTATQRVHQHKLSIEPAPASTHQSRDAFGNLRTFFSLQSPHETLAVEADSLVETTAPPLPPDDPAWRTPPWEQVREHFRYRAHAPYDPAAEFLFASPHVRNLVKLRIAGNRMGVEAAEALAATENLPRLRDLDLTMNQLGNAGAQALLEAPWLGRLTRLVLIDNGIGVRAARALRKRLGDAVVV